MSSAPTRTAAHLLVAFLLFVLSLAYCQAQGRRVFPLVIDTLAIEMPEAYKIQAADSFGENTYAVWGTWGVSSEGDTVCRLVSQLIVGTTPVGEPVVIHSDASRPSNAVSVIALPTGFLVLWNDYRSVDSGEIYARVVRTNGEFTAPEEIWFAESNMAGSVETYGDAANGQVLRWTSGDGWTNLITIDNATRIVQPLRRYAGVAHRQYYDGGRLPDHTVLPLSGNRLIVIDERGARVLDDPPAYDRVLGLHHLDSAGRFTMISGDTLLTYATIYDSIPLRATVLDDPDSILGGRIALAGNHHGGVSAIYAKLVRDDITTENDFSGRMGAFQIDLFEQALDVDGVNRGTRVINTYRNIEGDFIPNGRHYHFMRIHNVSATSYCGGNVLISYEIYGKYVERYGKLLSEGIVTVLCAVAGRDGVTSPGDDCSSSNMRDTACWRPRESHFPVNRLRADTLSVIAVMIADTNIVLTSRGDVVPSTYLVHDRTNRFAPRGMYRGGDAYLFFRTLKSTEFVKLDETTRTHTLGVMTDPYLRTERERYDVREVDMKQSYLSTQHGEHVEPHRPETYIASKSTWLSEIYEVHGLNGLFVARNIFAYPTATGWRAVINDAIQPLSHSPDNSTYTEAPFPAVAWSPNSSTMMVRYHYQLAKGGPWQVAASLNDAGNVTGVVSWSGYDNIYEAMFPERVGSYLGIRQNTLYRVDITGMRDLGALPADLPSPTYTAWFGNDFIRYAAKDSSHLTIELMTTDPRALRKRTLEIAGPNHTFTFITNRGDSSLTILWVDSLGINGITLSKDFSRQIPRRRLVEKTQVLSLTGVFQDDSLHVVWDDARDGVRTLYRLGVAVVPPDDPLWVPVAKGGDILASVEYDENGDAIGGGTATAGAAIEEVEQIESPGYPFTPGDAGASPLISHVAGNVTLTPIPNPATSSIELRVRLTQSWPVTITIADESGRVVLRRELLSLVAGENRFMLDLRELSPGAYTVVLEAGKGKGEGKLVMTPR